MCPCRDIGRANSNISAPPQSWAKAPGFGASLVGDLLSPGRKNTLPAAYPLDERIPCLRRLPFYRLFHITDLYTEKERKTSEAYNVLRTIAHTGNAIDVRLEGSNGSRILWEVNDPLDVNRH